MASWIPPPTSVDNVTLQQSAAGVISVKTVARSQLAADVGVSWSHSRPGAIGAAETPVAIAAGVTRFAGIPFLAGTILDPTEAQVQTTLAKARKNMLVAVDLSANTTTGPGAIALRVGGFDQGVPTVVTTGTPGVYVVGPFDVAAGSVVSLRLTSGAGGAGMTVRGIEWEATDA